MTVEIGSVVEVKRGYCGEGWRFEVVSKGVGGHGEPIVYGSNYGPMRECEVEVIRTAEETALGKRYQAAHAEFDAASEACRKHFYPLAEKAIKAGDLAEAKEIALRCPDHITRCFIFDAIRQARPETRL